MLRIILLFLLFPLSIFSQTNQGINRQFLTIDSAGNASICLSDSVDEIIYLQNFKWNKWITLDSIQRKSTDPDTCVKRKIEIYYSPMDFRLQCKFPNGTIENERKVRIVTTDMDSCQKLACSPAQHVRITLRCPSPWEVYDQYGKLVKTGNSNVINIADLPNGGYFLNFANETVEFYKR